MWAGQYDATGKRVAPLRIALPFQTVETVNELAPDQAFRTRKDGRLSLKTVHTYAEPGEYHVVVKVIDILGNDTTKTVKLMGK